MKSGGKGSLFECDHIEHLESWNINLTCFKTRHEFLNSPYLVPLAKKMVVAHAGPQKRLQRALAMEKNVNIQKFLHILLGIQPWTKKILIKELIDITTEHFPIDCCKLYQGE